LIGSVNANGATGLSRDEIEFVRAGIAHSESAVSNISASIRLDIEKVDPRFGGFPTNAVTLRYVREYGATKPKYLQDICFIDSGGKEFDRQVNAFDGRAETHLRTLTSGEKDQRATIVQEPEYSRYFTPDRCSLQDPLGLSSPVSLMGLMDSGKTEMAEEEYEGTNCYVITIDRGDILNRFWIDGERGFSILRSESWVKKEDSWKRFSVMEDIVLEEFGNGIWFPVSARSRWYENLIITNEAVRPTKGGEWYEAKVETIKVENIEFNKELGASDFAVKIPEDTRVYDARIGKAYTVGRAEVGDRLEELIVENFSKAELARRGEELMREGGLGAETPVAAVAAKGRVARGRYGIGIMTGPLAVIAVCLLAALGIVKARRRRQRREAA
jgi:hypothetical protein